MNPNRLFLMAAASALSCTLVTTEAPPRAAPVVVVAPPTPAPTRTSVRALGADTRVPFTSSLVAVGAPSAGSPTRLALVARFESSIALTAPVAVSLRVPAGVRLVSGSAQYVISGLAAGAPHEHPIVLEYLSVPNEDLVMVTDVQGDGFGSHGESAYRFGRELIVAPVAAGGSPSSIHGANVGAAVVVSP